MKKKTAPDIRTDIAIIGGGLSGLSLAALLGRAGVSAVVVDRDDPAAQLSDKFDGRTTAISLASRRILEGAGVWTRIEKDASPIADIRVADGDMPFFLHFSSQEDGEAEAFGWIVENRLLRRAIFDAVHDLKNVVTHLAPAAATDFFHDDSYAGAILSGGQRLSARLLVGADGRQSAVREFLGIPVTQRDYGQSAIVCNVVHGKDHENAAVEHFLPAGPFAILPMTDDEEGRHRSSVVWTVEGDEAAAILSLPERDFDAELQSLFGEHLGKVRHVTPPAAWPLRLQHAASYRGPRIALMAEAAHVIHPIAGQGLNLSLRDAAVLAELAVDALRIGMDPGSAALLENYEKWRRYDTKIMALFTDGLNRMFSNNWKSGALARGLGLGIVQKTPYLRGFFARQAMGLGGVPPRLVRGLPL